MHGSEVTGVARTVDPEIERHMICRREYYPFWQQKSMHPNTHIASYGAATRLSTHRVYTLLYMAKPL